MKTPTTPQGLTQYDHLPWQIAVLKAWGRLGERPDWHVKTQLRVAKISPLLALALESGQAARLAVLWRSTPTSDRARIADAMPLMARALDRKDKQ